MNTGKVGSKALRFLSKQPARAYRSHPIRTAFQCSAPGPSSPPHDRPHFPCVDAHAARESKIISSRSASSSSSSSSSSGPEPPYARPNPTTYNVYHHHSPLPLVYADPLPSFDIAYETWGTLSPRKDNVILLHTGLSASSHAASTKLNPADGWWEKFIGPGRALDTNQFFIICTNVLGGCYGSTGPSSIDPITGEPYATRFPVLSIFDMVRAQFCLLDHLGIHSLYASVGSSMGAMQSLAAGWLYPERVGKVVSISGTARSSPSAIAMRFAQRSVLMADPNWKKGFYYDGLPPHTGMKLARPGLRPLSNTPVLILGVQSDILFPVEQQREVADALRIAGNQMVSYYELGGVWGHDTFFSHTAQLTQQKMRAKVPGGRVVVKPHRTRYGPFALHTALDGPMPQADGREEIEVKNPANGERLATYVLPHAHAHAHPIQFQLPIPFFPAPVSPLCATHLPTHAPADRRRPPSARIVSASQEDVRSAIYSAHEVFKAGLWSRAPASTRATVLANLARDLEERVPELAKIETLQTGRAIREMKAQLGRLPEWLDYYASVLRTHTSFVAPTQGPLLNYVQRVPLGVVAQVIPFNHPLLIAVKKIAPALAAGNSVIVKPSELAPISVLEFAEMAVAAGVPAGVLQVLPGYGRTVGKQLVSDPAVKKVDITAGTDTGRAIGKIVGANLSHYTAELGGKAPILVFGDADVPSAVNGAAFACFVASGQTCVSGTRLLVQDDVYDEFMDGFLQKAKSITERMGNPLNPKSTMGSVISLRQLQRIEGIVQRGVGTILAGGKRMMGTSTLDGFDFSQGAFFPPTVITDVPTEDDLWREEIFGPVVVVKRFSSEQEGIDLANGCKYGLGAGVWTQNLSRAHRVSASIQAGLVWVNTHHRNDPSSPWGGMKDSGIGRENGIEAFEAYTQSKSTIVNIASAEETRTTQDWFAEDDAEKRYG
ncbi:hypothetical protein BN946_scf185015.g60 [Trametes cinnabarina]|uniref:Aldehyde dehydrogenase domain-containing protein n=1 Tax=Pycnoporus cinnabarinus TaxID=5643 RepID=A0A060SGV4_PYCCI|nr:hypothetical protein BN946_scf185015.g60 [Trametes cinnabarina]